MGPDPFPWSSWGDSSNLKILAQKMTQFSTWQGAQSNEIFDPEMDEICGFLEHPENAKNVQEKRQKEKKRKFGSLTSALPLLGGPAVKLGGSDLWVRTQMAYV